MLGISFSSYLLLPTEWLYKEAFTLFFHIEQSSSRLWKNLGYWLCAYRASEEALRKADYEEDLEWGRTTVTRVMFERLAGKGRASLMQAAIR
ncbi:MAG: hypothetical protein ABSG50_15695 [Opitutaceae bacterium]|jgi:hypothetical protein